jgi:ATP-binding cassette subfamily B protein/subfamily B ATP-binding cassette protein MsbA
MAENLRSSRRRFAEYRRRRREAMKGVEPEKPTPMEQKDARAKKRSRTFWSLFAAFWGLLGPHRPKVIAALGTLTGSASLILIAPAATKFALDYVITDHPGPAGIPGWLPGAEWMRTVTNRVALLWVTGAAMVGFTLARILIGMWGRWQMTRLTKRTQIALRRRVFDHAVALPLHRVQQIKSGGAASMLREDAGGSAELLFNIIYNPWNAIVQLAWILIVLTWVDWRMLIGALVLIPVVWMTHKTWIARIRPLYRDIKQTRMSIDAHATEAFGGIRVVRGFDRARGEAARFSRSTHFMARQEILTWWWSRGIDIGWNMMVPVATTGVLVYGGRGVIQGWLTIGDVMMFSMLLVGLLGPLEVLATSASEMQNNLASLDRILDVLSEPREFAETKGEVIVDRSSPGRVTLRDVWFSYPPPKAAPSARSDGDAEAASARAAQAVAPVIKGVSLDVLPGQTVALVGPSGSGKTTLCNLIARFYDPTRGVVELDGVDLKRIDVNSYRRLLGIVEQDVFLFDGTVAENIGYGRRDATPAQVEEAARSANAHGFIEKLEHGYDTLIGERGVRLSGGQKQRLAIARALLADPRILILDEATSNLDTESERLIQRSLTRLMQGRTSFVIAHRLSTIRHADLIVVIEDGRVLETGTHEALMAHGGRYADFLKLQLEPDREPAKAGQSAS